MRLLAPAPRSAIIPKEQLLNEIIDAIIDAALEAGYGKLVTCGGPDQYIPPISDAPTLVVTNYADGSRKLECRDLGELLLHTQVISYTSDAVRSKALLEKAGVL